MAKTSTHPDNPTAGQPQSRMRLWHLVIIAAATLIVYANSLHGVFLLDDQRYILDNPRIKDLSSLFEVLSHRRPLLDLSLAVNYAFHGTTIPGYHIFNVAIHLLAAVTLYGLVHRCLTRSSPRWRLGTNAKNFALAVALIWSVHPLQTQSVSYIIQRSESMMGLFLLLMLYAMVRCAGDPNDTECDRTASPTTWIWMAVAVLSCAGGMASKPVMVVAPLIALFFDRALLSPSWRSLLARRWVLYGSLAATWWILIPTGVAPGVLSTSTEKATVGFSVADISPIQYLLSQSGVILRYFALVFWPNPQCLDYGWPTAQRAQEIIPQGIAMLGFLAAIGWSWFRCPRVGFVGVFFLLVLAPTSSFVPIRDLAFEHRMYLPLASVVILGSLGVTQIVHSIGRLRIFPGSTLKIAPALMCFGIVVFLSAKSIDRNRTYLSPVEMWAGVTDARPNHARAFAYLAAALDEEGRRPEALLAIQRAVELDPLDPLSHSNLGEALYAEGRIDEAINHYREALALDPLHARANRNYGLALSNAGQLNDAEAAFRRAAQSPTERPKALLNLCAVLFQKRDVQQAASLCQEAVDLNPDSFEAHFNLGLALLGLNERNQAIAHFQTATQIQPDMLQLRIVLGSELARTGQFEAAIREFEHALSLEPDNEFVRSQLNALRNR